MRVNQYIRRLARCWAAVGAGVIVTLAASHGAYAISLEEAVAIALDSNPEIGQATQNREAIEFELRQARALYKPRIDLQAGSGIRQLDSPDRRRVGLHDEELFPSDVGGSLNWLIFDGFGREAEVERQASRVDGASHRVFERSEFIALSIAREYFEILLQGRIIDFADDNLAFHRRIRSKIAEGVSGGTLPEADLQQGDERLEAAKARLIQSKEELEQARIRFFKLVAQPASKLAGYRNLSAQTPPSLDEALGYARENNPRIKLAIADLDAATALVKAAKSRYYPKVSLEGSVRHGQDIDGVEDRTSDYQARVVTSWNLYAGGGDIANEQEQIRWASEARYKLHQVEREVDEALRAAWTTRDRQSELRTRLVAQTRHGSDVVQSYEDQFVAGKRTLLDLLSAQNTYFNTRVLAETAKYSAAFASYRILASTGHLVASLGLQAPSSADPYARVQAGVPETPPAETDRRYSPDRSVPMNWHTVIIR